jgi:uncharacterized membrane protein
MQAMAWVIESRRSVRGRPLPASSPPSLLLPVFVAVAAASLGIAVAFALAGAWPVLPFAGLELAALGWGIHRFGRQRPAASPEPCAAAGTTHRRNRPANRIRMINQRRKPF